LAVFCSRVTALVWDTKSEKATEVLIVYAPGFSDVTTYLPLPSVTTPAAKAPFLSTIARKTSATGLPPDVTVPRTTPACRVRKERNFVVPGLSLSFSDRKPGTVEPVRSPGSLSTSTR